MIPPTLGDASAVARVLIRVAPEAQFALARQMLVEAEEADAWRRERGQFHPTYGDGSLMAVAMRRQPLGERFLTDATYINALKIILTVLHQVSIQPDAQEIQSVAAGSNSNLPRGGGSAQSTQSPYSPASIRSSAASNR